PLPADFPPWRTVWGFMASVMSQVARSTHEESEVRSEARRMRSPSLTHSASILDIGLDLIAAQQTGPHAPQP
ncbi:hypothetical protein, partial [Streptomyces sp. NL15-2K]|uniref:hypothetical protein n=1 Tax=Streptomyces sp. NL15-2K TaxID=376149 RepID=UPI001C0F1CDE